MIKPGAGDAPSAIRDTRKFWRRYTDANWFKVTGSEPVSGQGSGAMINEGDSRNCECGDRAARESRKGRLPP